MPAGIERGERRFALDEMQGCAPGAAGFGEDEGAGGEVEGGEPEPPIERCPGRAPVQTAGDHEMHDQEQSALEPDHDPLPHPPELDRGPAAGRRDRRIDGLEEERARDPDPLELLAEDPWRELFEIDGQIW